MALSDWVRETYGRVRSDGIRGVKESAYEFWIGALRRADSFADPGENIYDYEWDVLVVLDATRVDAMEAVADDFDFIEAVETFRSPGSATYQWIQRTFTEEYSDEMAATRYVTANPFSNEYLSSNEFAQMDEVWRYAWDDELNTVPARAVTDKGIEISREESPDRLILHYLQPHFPSVPKPLNGDLRPPESWGDGTTWESPWVKQRKGLLDGKEVWDSYLANLRYVLEDVTLLRDNIDADKLVITSDHGNARGEWGIYGHPNVPLTCLREVPWIVTTARDSGEHEPASYATDEQDVAEERLKQLGYM